MLVDKQSKLMKDLLFTVHQHGGDDVTWKPPCVRLENPDLDFENLNPDFLIVSDHLLSAVTSDELINKRQIKKEEL